MNAASPTPGWWPALLLISGLLVVVDFSLTSLVGMETDIWWQLAAGQRFFQHGLELTDPYSVTFYQHPWIRIDWLFQVFVYGLYHGGGIGGLLLARSAIFVVSALLLARVVRTGGVSWGRTWVVVLLTADGWSQAAGLRPGTLSTLFMCLWLLILEQARRGQTRRLWLLPPLMVVWYNFHVAALAGLLMLGLYAFGQMVDWLAFRQPKPDRLWLAVLPATLAATLLTPQPGKLLYEPIQFLLFKSPWNQIIREVQAPTWDWPGTTETRLLLGLASLASVLALRQKQSTGVWLCLVCGYLMNATYRHQFQLSCMLTPLAGLALQQVSLPTRWGRPILVTLALLLATRSTVSLLVHKLPPGGLVRRESYPETTAAWLASSKEPLAVFTDMNYGGYYLWFFEGRQKVFIDSRTDQVYLGHKFVEEYFHILNGDAQALPLLDHYQLDVVALQHLVSDSNGPLAQKLSADPGWRLCYRDNISEVFARTSRALPEAPQPQPYLGEYNQGRSWQRTQRGEVALDCFYRSLTDYPHFASAHQAIAQIWLEKNQTGAAGQHLALAELDNPETPNLAQDWTRWAALSGHSLLVRWPALHWYCLPFMAL